ncbi:hypothetical protein B0T26DRAFT_6817 [Lasiosphaeria miniovina]|uniref:MIT domain-containing protein n=1 Tax=Lasiosphaeria miniovina TaxID=1954250 RepID=A0AA40EFB3_9PEZI|nr:uncharacterized protein B0T26DRAFT_6817 [Lasiosphaeria miniovina]KAK0733173.1 hypothetical protein B0T26DRAFT_6817 [Lasiosphaeria miniovina]
MPSYHPAATLPTLYPVRVADYLSTTSLPPRSSSFRGSKPAGSQSPSSSRTRRPSRDSANLVAKSNRYPPDPPDLVDSPAAEPRPAVPSRHKKASSATTHRTSYTAFPPHSLPQTPTLFPPARITFDLAAVDAPSNRADLFHDPALPSASLDPAKELEPPRTSGHSRSRSTSGLSDSFRNLNRWSASTTSSRASNLTNFTRRVSSEVLGGAFSSPSKKLRKSRSSTVSGSPQGAASSQARSDSPLPAPIPPLLSLPQITTGPSLEDEFRQSNVLGEVTEPQRLRYIRRLSDDLGLYWDGIPQISEEKPGLSSTQQKQKQQKRKSAESLGPLAVIELPPTMLYTAQIGEPRGHSRSRSTGAKGSADSTGSKGRDRERDRAGKPPSQRAMLSKALQKANTAVQLDNAQNTEGARRAYSEACTLLQQVLQRTSGDEDRNKLEAIHKTYTSRIDELDELLAGLELAEKELPQRPESNELQDDIDVFMSSPFINEEESSRENVKPAVVGREQDHDRDFVVPSYSMPKTASRLSFSSKSPPNLSIDVPRDGSRFPKEVPRAILTEQYSLQSAFSRTRFDNGATLQPHVDNDYLPPPLSPRRPLSPAKPPPPPPGQESPDRFTRPEYSGAGARLAPAVSMRGHQRANSHESVSWLDPIDESGGSAASSVHSRSSSLGIRRKHIRAASGDTEAEFDAALDDAIEAAYDEGYEPETPYEGELYREDSEDVMAKTLRRVELARERVRESERETLELANEREKRLRLQQQLEDEEYSRKEAFVDDFWDGHNTDEEERVLEEMTRGYVIEDFAFGRQVRSSVPRESDSSGVTSRTWHSSMGSNPPTATTILTTVSENTVLSQIAAPLHSPPKQALPQIPQLPPQPSSAGSQGSNQSVRNRRLSGQNPKQLKIETTKLTQAAPPATAGPSFPSQPKTSSYIVQQRQALSAGPSRTNGPPLGRPTPSPVPGSLAEGTGTPPLPTGFVQDDQPRSGSPSVSRPVLRKNFSSSSLKSLKSRNLSVSNMDDASDMSPGTPLSNQFGVGGSSSRLPALPSLPTPLVGSFKDRVNGPVAGGLHLFDSHFHLPNSPGSPNTLAAEAPALLEPCPNDVMLRPFWLMRCLYQTMCHPRGGYLSNKLFVPRDVWRVKGVKLKYLEDKISNCDYLTAALQKLARVDTIDADAVLEEMQSLEGVLEQVQATLSRKLGSEVGVQGTSTMFKDANAVESEASSVPRSASVMAKGSGFSWRRLRSKNSSANLPALAAYNGKGGSGGTSSSATPTDGSGGKDALLSSLPMTNHPTSRPTKRNVGSVLFAGPNANYMSALARLFDAAQTIDQIARQVDDPGLRHADKTQVGLELCTRHAAEFFGFYICRFVLSDLTMMLDKFVKRGTEWVLV